jgi:mRNA interferase YafQ
MPCLEIGRAIGDCHLWPDLLLIYAKPSPDVLRLVRLGSHSDLFE